MDRYQELERALAPNGEAKKKQNPAESEVFKMATKKTTNERIREILVEGEYQKNRRNNFWNARRCKKAKRVAALYNTAVVEKLVQDRVIFPSSGADLQEKARHTNKHRSMQCAPHSTFVNTRAFCVHHMASIATPEQPRCTK